MTKYLFIINPASGKGRGRKLQNIIQEYLNSKSILYDIIITEGPNHATKIVAASEENYKYIISVGGDGTLNEVINGCSLNNGTVFGVLPIGSGNDFALNLGLKKNLISNLEIICSENANIKECDICQLEYFDKFEKRNIMRRFINNLGLGFDAQVAFINQHKKIFSGIISYVFAVLRALLKYKPINFVLKLKDAEIKGEKLLLTFGNGVSSGGGFYLTPHAKIDDNSIALTTIDFISRFKLLRKLPLALVNKMDTVKEASMYKTMTADVSVNGHIYIHTDGESSYINTDRIIVNVLEKKIKFITAKEKC